MDNTANDELERQLEQICSAEHKCAQLRDAVERLRVAMAVLQVRMMQRSVSDGTGTISEEGSAESNAAHRLKIEEQFTPRTATPRMVSHDMN